MTRFAPSPTGRLHLGHALSALLNHRRARAGGGRMILRIEDIDTARCRPEFVQGICDDLRWLGVDWDAYEVQSEHAARHAAALDRLRELGVAYRCICTRAEIAASASAPHGDGGPAYPGTCRVAPPAEDDARPFAWRLDAEKALAVAPAEEFEVGSSPGRSLDMRSMSNLELAGEGGRALADGGPGLRRGDAFDDIVLARKGLGTAYHLAVVVDDAAAGVTDVIRGRDLLTATPVQNLLQRLLGLPVPRYVHHRLIAGPDGKRLAKRTPGATLAELRADGTDPADLRRMLFEDRLPVGFGWVTP